MNPDEWGAENRVYAASAGIPGPRDPKRTPYAIFWERAIASGRYRRCVMVCSGQVGKTDGALDVIGERLDRAPAPIIYVGPSKEFNTDQFEPRLMDLFAQSASLSTKIALGRRMKKTKKLVAGVTIRLAHAGSATSLKSDPAALVIVDEYDGMMKDVKGQGDPLVLAEVRGDTYADFTAAVVSTPSRGSTESYVDEASGLHFWKVVPPEDVSSPIWKLWQQGTMLHFCWPCPHCKEFFVPRFSSLRWDKPDDDEERKVTPSEAKRSAHVVCPRCGGIILDDSKEWMNAGGIVVAPGQRVEDGKVVGDPPDTSTFSLWVSGLCSPFKTFGERAESYVSAVRSGDMEKVQTVVNGGFGELWIEGGGDAPRFEEVREHVLPYKMGDVPAGARFLTMAVDVQKNKLYVNVRAWGPRATSWLIDRTILYGETVETEVWSALADAVKEVYAGRPLTLVLIDSGFRPGRRDALPLNRVYEFCRRFPRFVRPTKGSSTPMTVPILKSRIEVTSRGAAASYGMELLRLDADHWKSWVHERLRWPVGEPGSWYLPEEIDEDYFKQLLSEARVTYASGRHGWVQRSKDNHWLDCEAMQAAAGQLLNVQRIAEDSEEPVVPRQTKQVELIGDARTSASPASQGGSGWFDVGGGWFDNAR